MDRCHRRAAGGRRAGKRLRCRLFRHHPGIGRTPITGNAIETTKIQNQLHLLGWRRGESWVTSPCRKVTLPPAA